MSVSACTCCAISPEFRNRGRLHVPRLVIGDPFGLGRTQAATARPNPAPDEVREDQRNGRRPATQPLPIFLQMKHIPSLLLITALAFTACDSKEERARKAALENHADSLEDQAKATKKPGGSGG